ncbi:MAG: branched-chain amino acid ABC transporter permease [Verrucomicrobia bacterium]|nr:branched-chain amino acid ABC transporter permease [Verrucomicrobiota bacterium]
MNFTFAELVQLIFSGVALGMIYALLAFGYNITFSTSRTLNFSQGDFLMLGAFISYTIILHITGKRLPPSWLVWALALVAAATLGGLLAIILQQVAIKPALKTGSDVSWILATISLGIIAKNVAERIWGTDDYPVRSPLGSDLWSLFGGKLNIDPRELMIIVAAALIMVGFEFFRRKSLLGKAVTAVAADKDAAALMGINVPVVIAFSFIVSCAIAAMGGVLVGPLTFVSASMGALLGVKAYAVSVIGGLQSGLGVIAGGLILGLSEQLTARFVSTGYKDTPGFIILILILLLKPDGLFGKAAVKKV